MPFLGTTPTQGFVGANPKQSFTADGSTTVFTLTNPVATANDLEVFVGNVRQEPTAAYSAAGTTLTMTEAPDTGLNFYVINKSQAQVTTSIGANSVSTDKIVSNAVTNAKIATGITATKLTGTVASARFPTGSVINTTQGSVTSGNSASATTSYVAIATLGTVTTTQASSKILVMSNVPVQVQKTNMIVNVQVRSSLDSYSASLQQQHMTNYDTNGHDLPFTGTSFIHTHGQAAGVAITYKYYVKGSNTNAGFYSPDAWGQSGFSYNTEFLEIAG